MAEKKAAAFILLALALDDDEKRKQISFSTVCLFHLYFCFPAAVEGTAVAVASILKMTVSDFFHANHIHSNKNIRMRTKTFEYVINDSK